MGNFIKEVWEQSATKHGKSHWASWGDKYAIALEINEINELINDTTKKVLDVGCSNGYAAFIHAQNFPKTNFSGIDFSEKMIEYANERLDQVDKLDNLNFKVGDIRNIEFDDETFDLTYTTRVVINLPTWEEQKQGILECLRVTKKGGIVVLSEAFWEPLVKINALRQLMGLDSLVEHDFNRYIKKSRLIEFISELNLEYEVHDFSSIYYLGSRVMREIVTDHKSYEGYENPINELFYSIEKEFSGGDIGIQQAFIIKK